VINELQDHLLARDRELGSQEGAIIAWEEILTAFTRVLREARAGHDASCAHAGAVRHDYLAQVTASSYQSE
jgi:hypothetical protein